MPELKKMAKPTKGKVEITQVASISAGIPESEPRSLKPWIKLEMRGWLQLRKAKVSTIDIEYKEGMSLTVDMPVPIW